MWQLNLAMSEDETVQIVDLYDTTGKGEMRYEQLVKDVCAGVRGGVLASRPTTKKRPPCIISRGDDPRETPRDA
jgi:hypothetical protein